MSLTAKLKNKWRIFKYLTIREGWRSYTRLDGGAWQRVTLPRMKGYQRTFAADPFLFRYQGDDWLFYETMTEGGKGVLGCSKEINGKWVYQGIALEEPWHLSYPQVFEEGGRVYMIPESCKLGKGDVCLYEAVEFPLKWRKVQVLIDRPFADSTVLKHEGHWYMACYLGGDQPHAELWQAEWLTGPWMPHPMSRAITQTLSLMRCGGRFVVREGRLCRVAQDCDGFYGIRLWLVPVEEISPTAYREGEAKVLIDVQDPPKAMKHTYNEIEHLEVVDVHWDVLKPLHEIFGNFGKVVAKWVR